MRQMVKNHINKCDKCARNKQTRHIKESMTITDTPDTSFQTISIGTVGPLKISNGYRYILTMQCELTKFVIAHPMETKDAKSIAQTLVEQLILKFGLFTKLKSDRGTEFTNELMKNICDLLKIDQIFSTPYHHESLGSLEKNHRKLGEYLLSFADDFEWDKWIPYYTFAYNSTPHVDNLYTPFELVFGKLPSLPSDLSSNETKHYNLEDYKNELQIRLRTALNKARKLIHILKTKRKTEYDKNINVSNFEVGDLVLVKLENRKKSQSPYKGPYIIKQRQGVNSVIEIKNNLKTFHNNLLKKFHV